MVIAKVCLKEKECLKNNSRFQDLKKEKII